jgi:hypothetical protein
MLFETQPHLPIKRIREESDPESDCEDTSEMDFQHTQHVTETQALNDAIDNPNHPEPQLPPPLSPEHAALRADLQMITGAAMESLYIRITADTKKSVDDAVATLKKTNSQLEGQILSLNARMSQLQQQILTLQPSAQVPTKAPITVPVKKVLKLKLAKKNTEAEIAGTAAATANPNNTPESPLANTRGWETVPPRPKTKISTPKLIPTKYPQAEREVTCFFENANTGSVNTQPEKTYAERQIMADTALRRINTAFSDMKDVFAPPFIRARVTVRGAIIFTTGNDQNNIVYEDYITIIKHTLSYFGTCEKVEIGKRFSQFLLHGVPTHLSIPEISDSITANYPQLVQGQTPRWLTPTERREHKTASTIVMTLTGNVKKNTIGRQNLIVCNRECQLDDYIPYGRSTQCHNCQTYGHPAALCRNDTCCAVCAGTHSTREHPCTLPTCKKGPACIHPPIRCVNCNAPHKANDPNCPERIKLRTFGRTATTGDAPMAGVAE